LKADNIVMQSSLQFTKVLEEELIAKGNCNLKGIRLFWNMVDRRGRKNLYDAWNRVIHRMGLRLLSSHIPNTLRYN
ncbi:ParA family protein, partial [Barnesiella sp. GGCC_0306]|nr:ParA family protein [Barnesiella sp. GGCC_0306]